MADPVTSNIGLAVPTRGSDVGTWDTPANNNMTLVDAVVGGNTTISLNNSNIVLSAAQFQSGMITFVSTLTGSLNITFPSSFTKGYTIQNLCTGSSAFIINLAVAFGSQIICCPPGEMFDCWNDGINMKFRNLGRVGSLVDYYGTGVPAWISNCTIPPYLYCNGTSFSSATYPILTTILGGNVLPDCRGRVSAAFNDGTGRLTGGIGGPDGNTLSNAAGADRTSIVQGNLPNLNLTTTISSGQGGHQHGIASGGQFFVQGSAAPLSQQGANNYQFASLTDVAFLPSMTGTTPLGGNGTAFNLVQPTVVTGIRMIRAA